MATQTEPLALQSTEHVCPQCGDGTVVFVIDSMSPSEALMQWSHDCGYQRRYRLSIRRIGAKPITQADVFDDLERLYRVEQRQKTLLLEAAAPQAQAAE